MPATALIVDDSLTVRMDLKDAFEGSSLTIVPCASLGEARAALAQHDVAVIVLDVMLPDGDGITFLDELRDDPRHATTPVLLLSTEAEVKDRVRGLKSGADDYVGKPYDKAYVVSKALALVKARSAPVAAEVTVLAIDDSPTFREALREILERAGYHVITAASGEEGLRLVADRRPDAVVVDGVLPGIDGSTVIRRMRLDAALRMIPCVLLTASDDENSEVRALDAGADAFARKDQNADVLLAKLQAVLRRATSPAAAEASVLGPKKILAVDDSPTYLAAVSQALRGEGYEVVQARSGEEAIEALAIERVDCILLDLLMPGIGGKETCRRIKAAPVVRDIPLIMLTSVDDHASMIDGLAAGADDYVAKSSETEVLRARVRAQLRRKQFEDENRRIRDNLLKHEIEAAEARAARELAATRAALIVELEFKNRELEAFGSAVSHDLKAPLRAIQGFSRILDESAGERLDDEGRDYLRRIVAASTRMGELVDDLLELSRLAYGTLGRQRIDIGALAAGVLRDLAAKEPLRGVTTEVATDLIAQADPRLTRILLENLLGNAWKFTRDAATPRIDVDRLETPRGHAFRVRDNGAGFDPAYASKLFVPFQRLHATSEFPGTGIGLATVKRVVDRHGGAVWAESSPGAGASFYFTLEAPTLPP